MRDADNQPICDDCYEFVADEDAYPTCAEHDLHQGCAHFFYCKDCRDAAREAAEPDPDLERKVRLEAGL